MYTAPWQIRDRLSKYARKALKDAYKIWQERAPHEPCLAWYAIGALTFYAEKLSGKEWARLAWWLMRRACDEQNEMRKRILMGRK